MFKEEKIVEICKKNKWRLTEPRLEVLRIISLSKKPIKAYDILKKLANKIKNPKPPTAYRAIEFWQSHHFIHRIEPQLNFFASLFCECNIRLFRRKPGFRRKHVENVAEPHSELMKICDFHEFRVPH